MHTCTPAYVHIDTYIYNVYTHIYMINILYLNQFFLNIHNDNDATLIRMIYANKILIFASSRDTQMRNELYLMLGSSYTVTLW